VRGLFEGSYSRALAVDRVSPRLVVDPMSIVATAEIVREVSERLFTKVPVVVVGIAKGHTIPADVDVRLVCAPEVARALRPEQVVAQVEVASKEAAGSLSLPVAVHLDRCTVHSTPPAVVVRW